MPIFGDLGSNFSKTNVRFEISTFKIGYMRNFAKIRKLILFGPKCPNMDIWPLNFQKTMSDFKSAPSKKSSGKTSLKG